MKVLNLLQSQLRKASVGTLVFGRAGQPREIFLERGAVYLATSLYSGKIDARGLKQSGLVGGALTPTALEDLVKGADLRQQMLPEILHDHGLIDREQLEALAAGHIGEELLDSLLGAGDSFHFHEGKVPERLFGSESLAGRISRPLGEIVSELRERSEVMRSLSVLLPSIEEVFVVTAEGMAYKQEHPEDFALGQLFASIDGFRDLRSLLDSVPFFEYFTLCLIRDCLDQEFLKKTILPELRGVSTRKMSVEEAARLLPYFKNAVKYSADELAARERLAVIHEKLGNHEEAVVQYNFIGDALYRMNKAANAIKAYHRALTLSPDEALVCEKIARIYREAAQQEIDKGNEEQGIQLLRNSIRIRPDQPEVFVQLVGIYAERNDHRALADLCDLAANHAKAAGRPELAIQACRQILARLPDHILFMKKLVNVCLDFRAHDEAARAMEDLADCYLHKGQEERALEILDKIGRLRTLTPALARKQKELRKRLRPSTEPGGRSRVTVGLGLGLVFVVAVYQLWSYTAWRGISRSATALAAISESTADPPGDAVRLQPGPVELHNQELAGECARFLRTFPASIFRGQVEDLLRRSRQRAAQLAQVREEKKRKILADATLFGAEGDRERVLATLAPLLELAGDDPWQEKARELAERLATVEKSAQELFNEGRAHEAAGEWRQAYRSYQKLLASFARSQFGKGLKLPVFVESLPPAVEVFRRDAQGSGRLLGRTPLPVHLSPGELVELELRAEGYHEYLGELDGDSEAKLFLLMRKPGWSVSLDGALAVAPALAGDHVLCGTDSGAVQAVDLRRRQSLWSRRRERPHELKYPPVVTREGVYVLWNDGLVEKLALPTGEVQAAALLDGLATSPLVPLETGHLVAVTSRGAVQVLRRGNLERIEQLPLADPPLALGPGPALACAIAEATLALATAQGRIAAYDTRQRKALWRSQVPALAGEPPVPVASALALITAERDLLLVDPIQGTWKVQPAARSAVLVLGSGSPALFWVDPEGQLRSLRPATGEESSSPLGFHPTKVHAACDKVAVVYEEGKRLLLLDAANLAPLWATQVVSPIESVVLDGTHTLVAVSEGRYARLLVYPR